MDSKVEISSPLAKGFAKTYQNYTEVSLMSPVQSSKIKGTLFVEREGITEIYGCSWGYYGRFDGCAGAESQISL